MSKKLEEAKRVIAEANAVLEKIKKERECETHMGQVAADQLKALFELSDKLDKSKR